MDEDKHNDDADAPASDEVEESTDEKTAHDSDKMSAEHAAAQADVMLEGARQHRERETSKSRNMIVVAILFALLGAIGVFFLVGGDDDSASTDTASESSTFETTETEQTPVATPADFSQVVYANSSAENLPRDLFNRPVTGGDRVPQDFNFGRNSFLRFARDGQSYAVLTADGDIYVAAGNETPQMVVSGILEESQILLDEAAESILVIRNDSTDFVNLDITVDQYAYDGTKTNFYTETGADAGTDRLIGVDWDATSQRLVHYQTCTGCGGGPVDLQTLDASGTVSTLLPITTDLGQDQAIVFNFAFNTDGTKALFVTATTYDESNPFGINGGVFEPQGAPYTLYELDVVSGNTNALNTFGEGDDVGDDGFFSNPQLAWAPFENGIEQPAYSYLTRLFVQNGQGNFDNYFETGQGDISSIYAVDQNEVLVGAGTLGDEIISYYNIDDQAGAIVMETLPTTSILTVTLE